jgi:FeS assembly SUF system protein
MDTIPQRVPLPTMEPQPPVTPALPSLPPAPQSNVQHTPAEIERVEAEIIQALESCYDPEIPVNIYELGLIYDVDIKPSGAVTVKMTLTSPACPVAGSLPPEVETKIRFIPGVTSARVDLVWEPPWDKNMMSEAARLQLGLFD